MYDQKLCIALMSPYGEAHLNCEEEIRLMRKTGFEGFFSGWGNLDYLKRCRRMAEENGMLYQSVHAPFGSAGPGAAKATVAKQLATLHTKRHHVVRT